MTAYHYEAMKIQDRSRVKGVINAGTEKEARELLRDQNLIPTKIMVISSAKWKVNGQLGQLFSLFSGISTKDKILFTRNMAMMARAGVPLTDALLYFENYCKNAQFKLIVAQIRKDILSGYSFSKALTKHKKLFNEVFITITEAGEKSGELEQVMSRITELLHAQDKMKMKIISALVYPILVLIIMCIVMLIMFIVVLPTFADIYVKLGVELPLITKIMMTLSDFLVKGWFISFPLMGAALFGLSKYIISPSGQGFVDRISLKIPVIDELTKFVCNSHFISTLQVSFGAGLPIIDALYLASQTVRNHVIRQAFEKINVQIQTGQKLAICLAETGYVPDVVLLMLSIGEESGELDRMLENSMEYLETEVNHRVEILMTMMEPILLLVLGTIVGSMALAIYLPLYGMYQKL